MNQEDDQDTARRSNKTESLEGDRVPQRQRGRKSSDDGDLESKRKL
jgi:hypothetical protein